MNMLKDGRYPILLDKERHLLFSLNSIADIEEKIGSFDKLDTFLGGEKKMTNLRWLLTVLLNEGRSEGEEELSEKDVGRMIHMGNMAEVTGEIYRAFAVNMQGTTKPKAGNKGKNVETGRVE